MKALISFAALAVTGLALQSLPAKAQDSTSSSGSTSSSSSSSGSVSGSRAQSGSSTSGTSGNQQRSNQRVNATTNIPITFNSADPAGGGSGGGSGGGAAGAGTNGGGTSTPGGPTGQPYYGQSDITVRTTPTVYAPPVSGGNPCTLAVSGGVSVIGWGAAAGGTFVDKDCADRQKIAMIHNAGYAKAAQELMCNDRATYMAFRGTDKPCNPRPEFDGPPRMSQQPAPPMVITPQPQPQPQQTVVKDRTNLPRCGSRVGGVIVTDNCYS